jgi:ABC-type antimicrobial peptide transport system permease subunit
MGLATLLLRNVLERRQELAILRAVGYRARTLAGIILYENFLLVCWGLTSGTICAFLAVIPALQSRGASFPFAVSGLILISVLAAGLVSSIVAVIAALRSPLLSALRSE